MKEHPVWQMFTDLNGVGKNLCGWVSPDTVEPIEIGDDFDDYNTQAYVASQQMLSHIFATMNPLNSNLYKVGHPHIIIQFNTVKYGS